VVVQLTDAGRSTLETAMPGHVALVQSLMFDALDRDRLAALAQQLEAIGARAEMDRETLRQGRGRHPAPGREPCAGGGRQFAEPVEERHVTG
jgi:hypothetical protein